MRVSILQSNYVPWIGYFNLIKLSDVAVVYDSAQYTKNDWRNRNRIAGSGTVQWLTIPISTSGKLSQKINEARVVDARWADKHWRTLQQVLGSTTYFYEYRDLWSELFNKASQLELLHDINLLFTKWVLNRFHISTQLVDDRRFVLSTHSATDRLIEICHDLGADTYLTGPAGLNYLDITKFADAKIALEVIDYEPLLQFDYKLGIQTTLSVLNTLASVGDTAGDLLTGQTLRIN